MLIHKMKLDDNMAVLDINSGAVHLVDEIIYDVLDVFFRPQKCAIGFLDPQFGPQKGAK